MICTRIHFSRFGLSALALLLVAAAVVGVQVGTDSKPGERPRQEKPSRTEEEDTAPPLRKPPRVFGEEDEKTAPAKVSDIDLAQAAEDASHRGVALLFRALAVPHDLVLLKGYPRISSGGAAMHGGEVHVELLPLRVTPGELRERLKLNILDKKGKKLREETPTPDAVLGIRYYEELAVSEVQEFLQQHFERLDPADARHLRRWEQLQVAEQALSAVVRFHGSARERGVRKGNSWLPVEAKLRAALRKVLVEQVTELSGIRAWEQAINLTQRLAETWKEREDQADLVGPVKEMLEKALRDPTASPERLLSLRTRLRRLAEQHPGNAVVQPIEELLRQQAAGLLEQAKKEKEPQKALGLLRQAEDTWPQLAGLRAFRLNVDQDYRVLRVGVRALPLRMSPSLATTDTELRTVELLFESLVKLSPDPSGMLFYRPGLAEGRPRVVPLGRVFQLPRNAEWSDGKPLTSGDVQTTVNQMKEGKGTGRSAAWGNLVERIEVLPDPSRVRLHLQQGYLAPLALATFKVLPGRFRDKLDDESFATNPVGSGPFRFAGGSVEGDGRPYLSFQANLSYGARPSKRGLHRIKEVRLLAPPDAARELELGRIDLALDLSAEQAASLQNQKPSYVVPLRSGTTPLLTPNQRIYFLAINNNCKPLLADSEVRVALARAIQREKLLDDHFRGPLKKQVHRVINGPYPAGSWPCDPGLVTRDDKSNLELYDADRARTHWKRALGRLGVKKPNLKLKYPKGDKALASAMADLCNQLSKELPGLRVEPVERWPYELRKDVEETQDYELAYHHHDFADETYWLLPLLGEKGRLGKENYLGYSGSLVEKIYSAMNLRDFSKVRAYAQAIHRDFVTREMPFIPLWQLDPLFAYRKGDLELPPVEPQLMFTDIELWRVTRKY